MSRNDSDELSSDQLEELAKMLNVLEQELMKDIELAKGGANPVALDQQAVGRVSRVDAIQQQQMSKASLQRLQQRLGLVQTARVRIASGDYGFCKVCEEPISVDRLRARPEATLCVRCAT